MPETCIGVITLSTADKQCIELVILHMIQDARLTHHKKVHLFILVFVFLGCFKISVYLFHNFLQNSQNCCWQHCLYKIYILKVIWTLALSVEVLTAVLLKIQVFWGVTLCHWVNGLWHFKRFIFRYPAVQKGFSDCFSYHDSIRYQKTWILHSNLPVS